MKNLFFTLSFFFVLSSSVNLYAQDSQISETLWVHDTRDINEPPAFFKQEIRADLKKVTAIGLDTIYDCYTSYGFSTNLSISPWPDDTAGFIHQLNFNDTGIYYRNGDVLQTSWNSWKKIVVSNLDGNVGIGMDNPQNKLDVNGTIRAKEIKVESNWADFVFKKGYNLPTLREVEQHINDNGTLPGVPSEKEVKANGINVGEANALLLQKIEELTLYLIRQQKEIDKLKLQMKNK